MPRYKWRIEGNARYITRDTSISRNCSCSHSVDAQCRNVEAFRENARGHFYFLAESVSRQSPSTYICSRFNAADMHMRQRQKIDGTALARVVYDLGNICSRSKLKTWRRDKILIREKLETRRILRYYVP